jgi:hypothetical protein
LELYRVGNGGIRLGINYSVLGFVANKYKQIAIQSLSTFVLFGQVFDEQTRR